MRKKVYKSTTPYPENFEGLYYYNKALYYKENDERTQITNVLNKCNHFSKLILPIQGYTRITSMASSQDSLDKGIAPDIITTSSPVIQPRKGCLRLWKNNSNDTVYLEFLEIYNEVTLGRPFANIVKSSWWPESVEWEKDNKFNCTFYRSDMSPQRPIQLANDSYFYNQSVSYKEGILDYKGNKIELSYIDVIFSWARITNPDGSIETWIVFDDGYTANNWVTIPEDSTYAAWQNSIMAQRFSAQYTNSNNHFDQVFENMEEEIVINGTTELSTGIGDIKMILSYSPEGYAVSFTSKNDVPLNNIFVTCKIILENSVRMFNLGYDKDNNIYFNSDAKIELAAYKGLNSSVKQEYFIDNGNKTLTLLSQQV